MSDHRARLARNAESKLAAEHDGEEWTADELEWLRSWTGGDAYLAELAELLGRTIEACRQRYQLEKHGLVRTRTTTTITRTTETVYRGWKEGDGDGCCD